MRFIYQQFKENLYGSMSKYRQPVAPNPSWALDIIYVKNPGNSKLTLLPTAKDLNVIGGLY